MEKPNHDLTVGHAIAAGHGDPDGVGHFVNDRHLPRRHLFHQPDWLQRVSRDQFYIPLSAVVLMGIIANYGSDAVVAFGILTRIEALVMVPLMGHYFGYAGIFWATFLSNCFAVIIAGIILRNVPGVKPRRRV